MSADARLADRSVAPVPQFGQFRVGEDVVLGVAAAVDERCPDIAYVVVSGALGPASLSTLDDVLDEVIRDGALEVHVDLSKLDICTSHGVGVLEDARRRMEQRGGILHLMGAHGVVCRVFDILCVPVDRNHGCRPGACLASGRSLPSGPR